MHVRSSLRRAAIAVGASASLAIVASGVEATAASASCTQLGRDYYVSSSNSGNSPDVFKANDSCSDFNEWYPRTQGAYFHGWYWNGSSWKEGSAGDVYTPYHGLAALIYGVRSGTKCHSQWASFSHIQQYSNLLF